MIRDEDKFALSVEGLKYVLKYLRHYGYIYGDEGQDKLIDNTHTLSEVYLTTAAFEDAIPEFQSFFGLKVDSILGPKTFSAMHEKRCGCKDMLALKDLSFEAMKWGKLDLTYTIDKTLSEFTRVEQIELLDESWRRWSQHTNITFTYTDSRSANVIYSTGKSKRDGFDGPGGTLAWAELPRGNNHKRQLISKYDEGETWLRPGETGRGRGVDFVTVATHENGHLLGLEHSKVKGALMAPFYNPNLNTPQQRDDVTRVQRLYGVRETPDVPVDPPEDPGYLTVIEIWGRGIDKVVIPNFRITKIR